MTDLALLEKLETLTRTVERLENRVEDLEDHRDLQTAITENAGKPLVEWDQAKKLLDLD
jgi:cell division protein FtsB